MDYYEDLMRGLYGKGGIKEPKLKCKHCGWEFKPNTKDFIDAFLKNNIINPKSLKIVSKL